ncbi:MAG: SRPBCC domain-containing protein [Acidobacteriota bacterium]|jgi:uncharacterized protein YndB with AHSA1/START domain
MRLLVAATVLGLVALPAHGELTLSRPDGFRVEHVFDVSAPPEAAYAILIQPALWWPSDHTWSGDAAHLSLDARAGGCFCEAWDGGSAEHGRVVMAEPGRLLRFVGALGPLQEFAVSAVLTVTLEAAGSGTRATVTYRVSGDAGHGLEALAPVVDTVIGQQFGGFARLASAGTPSS